MYHDIHYLLDHLAPADLAILDDLESFRLLTTRHLQRLHFPINPDKHPTQAAATKATMRALHRIASQDLVRHLVRRFGGVRHGSGGYIWQLGATGATIQRYRHQSGARRRYVEPTSQFTLHTLAVAEIGITLRELHAAGTIELLSLETEPAAWRDFLSPPAVPEVLKPDLHTVTATGTFEDHFFIEVDLATEHLPAILRKSHVYARYLQSGIEQRRHRIFPAVLWITTEPGRAAAMREAIRGDPGLPGNLFTVITTDQFPALITGQSP